MSRPNISADVITHDLELALRRMPADAQANIAVAVNRVAERLAQRIAKKTSEKYALSAEQLSEYIYVRKMSRAAAGDAATVQVQIKALPIEAFPVRVSMERRVLRQAFGRSTVDYSRALPTVLVKRYRDSGFVRIGGAFPLEQRAAGPLAGGERVRRRTSAARDKLTVLRFYNFPKAFVDDVLLPDAQAFIPAQFNVELRIAARRSALRHSSSAGGRVMREELVRNG